MELMDVLPQCCDARHYLSIGEACASGSCYDILRPMGAVYWFSLPWRLGLPAMSLMYFQAVLVLISIGLSLRAIRNLVAIVRPRRDWTIKDSLGALLASALAHALFVYPTLRSTLSDIPAGMLFLIGIWLLCSKQGTARSNLLSYLAAGLLMGLAAWIRSFYLYPLLIGLILWIPWQLAHKRYPALLLLIALLPISIQFHATWSRTGVFSYIDPEESRIHHSMVMTERVTGYDTALPGVGVRWYPSCESYQAMGDALKQIDIHSITCLLSGKLHYYLGSYSPRTFWAPEHGDILTPIQPSFLLPQNLIIEKKQGPSDIWYRKINNTENAELIYRFHNPGMSNFFFSMTAQSEEGVQALFISFRNPHSGENNHGKILLLTTKPQHIRIGGYPQRSADVEVVISFPFIDPSSPEVQAQLPGVTEINQGSFSLNDLLLEEAPFSNERSWHPVILLLNVVIWSIVLVICVRYRARLTAEHGFALLLILLCCAEALVITPEQRFIIAPMIFAWLLCLILIGLIIQQIITRK